MAQSEDTEPSNGKDQFSRPPLTPDSANKSRASPLSTPSTTKSKYSSKFNTAWLGKPSPKADGSPDSSNRPTPSLGKVELRDSAYGDVGDSYGSSLRYPPTRGDEDPPLSPGSISSHGRGSRYSPRYGGEARHVVPPGIVPSPPTSANYPRTRSRSRPAAPSEPTIEENQKAENSSSDDSKSHDDAENSNVGDESNLTETEVGSARIKSKTSWYRRNRRRTESNR